MVADPERDAERQGALLVGGPAVDPDLAGRPDRLEVPGGPPPAEHALDLAEVGLGQPDLAERAPADPDRADRAARSPASGESSRPWMCRNVASGIEGRSPGFDATGLGSGDPGCSHGGASW